MEEGEALGTLLLRLHLLNKGVNATLTIFFEITSPSAEYNMSRS